MMRFYGKIDNFFQHEIFFCATSTCFLSTQNTFLCNLNFFKEMICFFLQHLLIFVDNRLLFVQDHAVLFLPFPFFFRATTSFCFGPSLESYIMVIYFYCHIATKILSGLKKKFFFKWCKKKKNLGFVCITNFLHSTFMLHTGSMLIFFVVILETKNIYFIFSYLLTCLIYGDSY